MHSRLRLLQPLCIKSSPRAPLSQALRLCIAAQPQALKLCLPGHSVIGSLRSHSTGSNGSNAAPPCSAPAPSSAPAVPPPTDSSTMTFIQRAKIHGVNALMGMLLTSGKKFDRTMEGLEITKIEAGRVECSFPVSEGVVNTYGTLHGGAIATLVDVVGTIALLTKDPTRAGVTVEMSTSYLKAAKGGETVKIVGQVLKAGKTLGFTQVDIFNAKGDLLASGRHTKAL